MADPNANTSKNPSENPEDDEGGIYPVGKAVIGVTWLFATACFFAPLQSSEFGVFGRSVFVALAAVHAVECIAFLGVLRQSGRPLPGELWQTFLFGLVHVSAVRREIAQRTDGA